MLSDLQENFEAEKTRLESTVSILKTKMETNELVVQKIAKLSDDRESLVSNFTVVVIDRLDKMSLRETLLVQS